jgi:hypothetical protein
VPCQDGWYTTAVRLSWNPDPAITSYTSPSCNPVTYTADTHVVAECDASWSGLTIPFAYEVRVEISSPTATATLARPPDANGWYNHPVAVSFGGNSFSGIGSCTPPETYAGPTGANVMVSGSCTDNAGKTANASIPLSYDPTPPTITGATASRAPDSNGYYTHAVTFTFTGTDGASGIASCDTVTYSGPSSGSVVGGCHDQAGNYATISVPVRYRAATPRESVARTGSLLVLRWKGAAHASYYNVQVYRNGKKVLSTWPSRTSLRLKRTWKFAGHRFRLKPGRYRWYVWPGYGSRGAARYGRMIVSAKFTIAKAL